jgi:hypothetical protein
MTRSARASAARLVLVEQRRDTVAGRDPAAARVRRYRLARTRLSPSRPAPADVAARSRVRSV